MFVFIQNLAPPVCASLCVVWMGSKRKGTEKAEAVKYNQCSPVSIIHNNCDYRYYGDNNNYHKNSTRHNRKHNSINQDSGNNMQQQNKYDSSSYMYYDIDIKPWLSMPTTSGSSGGNSPPVHHGMIILVRGPTKVGVRHQKYISTT